MVMILFACVFIVCCDPATQNSVSTDSLKTDSLKSDIDTVVAAENNIVNNTPIVLKDISLQINVIERLAKSKQPNQVDFKLFSIPVIDSMTTNEFKYHLFDTLFWSNQVKIVLIGREYLEENIIWAASYDANNNLIDHLRVYYENSEGLSTVTSDVHNNLFMLFDHPDEGEGESKQKPSVYALNEAYKFVKQE